MWGGANGLRAGCVAGEATRVLGPYRGPVQYCITPLHAYTLTPLQAGLSLLTESVVRPGGKGTWSGRANTHKVGAGSASWGLHVVDWRADDSLPREGMRWVLLRMDKDAAFCRRSRSASCREILCCPQRRRRSLGRGGGERATHRDERRARDTENETQKRRGQGGRIGGT